MVRCCLFGFLLILAMAGIVTGDEMSPDSAVVFPPAQGSNLAGKKYDLPGDFEGRWNIVLIAFKREQQAIVDTWLPVGRYLEGTYAELRCYELPTLPRLNAVARYFIDNGMRGGIPDRTARERTITLYIDKDPFREALRIADEETIQILLLDESDRVIWRSTGPRTDEAVRELNDAVKRVGRSSPE